MTNAERIRALCEEIIQIEDRCRASKMAWENDSDIFAMADFDPSDVFLADGEIESLHRRILDLSIETVASYS